MLGGDAAMPGEMMDFRENLAATIDKQNCK